MIKSIKHLEISYFFHVPLRVLEFISKKFLSNSCLLVFQIIMPPRKTIKGRPARINIEESEVPNAPEVQPQGEVTIAKFREAIPNAKPSGD